MPESPRIEELKRRVQLDPASIAFAALAEEYRRTGRYEEAIEVCRTGLQRHPSYISAHVTLGRAFFEIGHYDDARQELEYVLSVAPENLAAIRGLAEIHHRQGQSSSESTDLTATEMADMLTVPHPIAPAVSSQPWEVPPPPVTEAPERMHVAPEPEPAVAEIVEPEPTVVETLRADERMFEIVQPPAIATSPPPAAAPIVAAVEPPKDDPALERLETFLHAILRARESAGGIHVS